jgi:glycosyltransferase involved in cell wall biosynthesis
MIDILVVSHACLTAINRAPYRRLARMGWNIEIVTADRIATGDITRDADPAAPDDPPIHFLPMRGRNLRFWRFAGLRQVLNRRRPRILMLDYDPGTRIALEAGWWARRHGAHVACLSYDNIVRSVPEELRHSPAAAARAGVVRVMSAAARAVVDHIFVLSSDGAKVMQRFGFAGRVSTIPLGFDPAIFRVDEAARTRVRHALGLRDVTFAYFGRLIPEKGAHELLRALHAIRDRPWQLLMDRFRDYTHPYTREIERLVQELGLGDRIVYFDASHEEIADYMNAADVVVMPSTSTHRFKEQYGRVATEAMACGRLIIVSSSGALPEIVGDAGLVVPEAELPRLHEHLALVLNDPSIVERLGRRGAERAHRHFSLPVQVRMMDQVFRQWYQPAPALRDSAPTLPASATA